MALVFAFVFGLVLFGCLVLLGRRAWRRRRRILREDALKQIYSAKQDGRSLTTEELAGRLGRSPASVLRLVEELEDAGYLRSHAGLLELTQAGESLGLRILRGHRLWERYLADEAQMPLDQLHGPAERAEHRLNKDDLELLADHLGHPRKDPHGDLIPAETGEVWPEERVPLTDWPCGPVGVIAHVEDEPPQVLADALHAGLRPGTALRILRRDARTIVCETAAGQCALAPAIAAHIDVCRAVTGEGLEKPLAALADLPVGSQAEIVALTRDCRGLRRRRLLDLGFTPGTRVEAVLASAGNSARAYRIRGTLVALRKGQAAQVLIKPMQPSARRVPRGANQ
jgi:DtxR family Mn-dependent transcriptional regulator